MKRLIILAALLSVFVFSGTALADSIVVNFGAVGSTTDITLPNSLTLDGIQFSYDPLGSVVDTASIDPTGIFGSTFGILYFDFVAPYFGATSLSLDFSVLGVPGPDPNSLFYILSNNGTIVQAGSVAGDFSLFDPQVPGFGQVIGQLNSGPTAGFNQAALLFSPSDTPSPFFFTVSGVSYNPVPEPSSVFLLATGLFGLAGWARYGRKS